MKLSDCTFHTGSYAACSIPDTGCARDALDELFTHSDGVPLSFYDELSALGLRLPQPPIRAITITPGPGTMPFCMQSAHDFAAEMMQKLPKTVRLDGVFYYINSRVQGIVSCPEETDMTQLYHALLCLVEAYPEPSRPHIAISNQYPSLTYISKACEENHEARLFERFLTKPIEVILQSKDFSLYGSGYRDDEKEDDDAFFGAAAQKICNAMITGNPERMHQVLDDVLGYMVGKFPRVSGIHMRAIHFCKPLEMTLVGADLIDRLFVQKFRLVQRVIETENEAELRSAFHSQMDAIWDYAQQRKLQNHGEIMHNIAEYIESNLSDSTLSILSIAESFHMHPNRLSALFREYYQESIPSFIHRRRIHLIKQKLLGSNLTIREIAEDTGYVSIATMNRAFLKNEGIYPGQYRKKMQIESRDE